MTDVSLCELKPNRGEAVPKINVDVHVTQPPEEAAPASTPQPSDTDNQVFTLLLAGVATLTTALGLVGTATGQVARMYRNYPGLTFVSVILVLIAFAVGLFALILWPTSKQPPRPMLVVAAGALVVGLVLGFSALFLSMSKSDRPSIDAKTTVVADGGGLVQLDATVEAGGARSDGTLVMVVNGVGPTTGDTITRLYYGKNGPNADGQLTDSVSLLLDPTIYQEVRVYAVAYRSTQRGYVLDCDSRILGTNGLPKPSTPPDVAEELVGCSTLKVPVIPMASPTPSPT